jgi:hypothetical protein
MRGDKAVSKNALTPVGDGLDCASRADDRF